VKYLEIVAEPAEPLPPELLDFSLILGGPLFQLLRRAHLGGDVAELVQNGSATSRVMIRIRLERFSYRFAEQVLNIKRRFHKHLATHNQNWEGGLTFEKVTRYLPHFKSAIQVSIYVADIDI
jgi:hypothetical protein